MTETNDKHDADEIKLIGSIPHVKGAINFHGGGGGYITIEVPDSEALQLVRSICLRNKQIEITLKEY